MNITIDASVFISATLTAEPHYAVSRAFLKEMRAAQPDIFVPVWFCLNARQPLPGGQVILF